MGAPLRFSLRIYGILIEKGRLLMTRSTFLGREFVNFPGGGVELGEAPMAALKREFQEETGLAVKPRRLLYASEGYHRSTQVPMQIVSVYWLVGRGRGKLRAAGNGEDVLSLFWTRLGRIPKREMFPADVEFVRRLPRLLKLK
jgi:8-oxo-dGTP pyrophosphatase MutT (NUDIX family)